MSHPVSPLRRERILVLEGLFMMDVGGATLKDALANLRRSPTGDDDQGERDWAYVESVTRGVVEEMPTIDARIRTHLQHWSWERLARVDRNLLRIGAWELLHNADKPFQVFISEAVDLAKEYGDDHSGGFVNGVLDAIWRSRDADLPPEAFQVPPPPPPEPAPRLPEIEPEPVPAEPERPRIRVTLKDMAPAEEEGSTPPSP